MNEKLTNVINSMKEQNIDQFIISDSLAVKYLTGIDVNGMERMAVLLVDVNGKIEYFAPKINPQRGLDFPVYYHDDTENPVKLLASHMRKSEKIGIDKNWTAKFLLSLMQYNLADEYVNASQIVDRVRQIKTADEQDKMRKASSLNDKAMEKLISLVGTSLTEVQMSEELLKIYKDMGAQGFSFEPGIAYGNNAADPHHANDDSVGKEGDCVVLDIGCILNGYCSDMTRTVFIGSVSDEAKKIYEIVKEANKRGIAAVKPGARFCDIDNAARSYITEMGYGEYFTHRLGHSIGTEVHEWGDVSMVNTETVRPGMTFSIEPGIYVPGVCGVRIEDLVLVTEDGCEVLNDFTKDLIIV